MLKFTKLILFSVVLTVVYQSLYAQQFDACLAARLQFLLDSIRTANLNSYRGVSAAVFDPNCGTWVGVSGISHSNIPIRPGMKFDIASNTKLFISTTMLKLQESNILSLDDSLHEWLPNFQYVNPSITIRQLLNHTSGVYNFTDHQLYVNTMDADTSRRWMPEEILTTFLNPPYFQPGQPGQWHYSNTNYLLAGMIIKAAADTTVSYKLRQFIFNPLNLTSTFFPLEEPVPDTIAHGWDGFNEPSYPWTSWNSSMWCSGNMYSTAGNLVIWYKALFGLQVINQSSLNQMLTFVPTTDSYTYGLGIMRMVVNGRTKWQHDGTWQRGYRSAVRIDSASKFVISFLINQNSAQTNPFFFVNAFDNAIRNWPRCTCFPTGIAQNNQPIPHTFLLYQNYPNPFNPVTNIKFDIAKTSFTKLVIYDLIGRETKTLINEELRPGSYTIDWDASNYPSGIYLYSIKADDFTETRKMMLIK